MYIATLQQFDYSGQKSKKQFAVYDSDTPVTFKKGQGHRNWYELVDPKQSYNRAQQCLQKSQLFFSPYKIRKQHVNFFLEYVGYSWSA